MINQAHRGYLIKQVGNDIKDGFMVQKDGHTICWAKNVKEAQGKIDGLFPDSPKVPPPKVPKRGV